MGRPVPNSETPVGRLRDIEVLPLVDGATIPAKSRRRAIEMYGGGGRAVKRHREKAEPWRLLVTTHRQHFRMWAREQLPNMSDKHWERLLKWKREFGIGPQWQGANYTPRPLKTTYVRLSLSLKRMPRYPDNPITENMYAR